MSRQLDRKLNEARAAEAQALQAYEHAQNLLAETDDTDRRMLLEHDADQAKLARATARAEIEKLEEQIRKASSPALQARYDELAADSDENAARAKLAEIADAIAKQELLIANMRADAAEVVAKQNAAAEERNSIAIELELEQTRMVSPRDFNARQLYAAHHAAKSMKPDDPARQFISVPDDIERLRNVMLMTAVGGSMSAPPDHLPDEWPIDQQVEALAAGRYMDEWHRVSREKAQRRDAHLAAIKQAEEMRSKVRTARRELDRVESDLQARRRRGNPPGESAEALDAVVDELVGLLEVVEPGDNLDSGDIKRLSARVEKHIANRALEAESEAAE